jgi:hypothetical protein
MNVACDEYAGEAAREHMECPEAPAHDILQPPYEGSKAMLKIGDLWITSDYDNNIHFASTAPALRKYCRKRHKWDKKTMELIALNMIDSIRKKQNWSNFVRSMKLYCMDGYQSCTTLASTNISLNAQVANAQTKLFFICSTAHILSSDDRGA